ncbi:dihydrolipoamide acetyltransferase [Plasmodium gonderi]|uniref:Dihydrolipoamide acetyltransferase component of pyruvate dehydrogenase complex n=1 Tax=Plasmodium gonderi TaxID=77519 RepID=A0A1Y1JCF1_PLAGO|nr:dihydrolipoamide acetyltransferase [Plasmodium gonderi]GAW79910.1 dihydrolipoamide acetyltransferase [Plasmodium gonderi]
MLFYLFIFTLCLRISTCISLNDKHGLLYFVNFPKVTKSNKQMRNRKGVLFSQVEIKMPALSSTMTSGKIVKWNKHVGDYVNIGDIIMTVESDKADMDVEAFDEGFLRMKNMEDGCEANVGDVLGILTTEENEKIDSQNSDLMGLTNSENSEEPNVGSVVEVDVTHTEAQEAEEEEKKTDEKNIFVPFVSSKRNRARINKWTRKENDYIDRNEILFHVEDDKSTIEVESPYSGIVKKILVKQGQFADLDKPVAIISIKKGEKIQTADETPRQKEKTYVDEILNNTQSINEENIVRHFKESVSRTKEGESLLQNMGATDEQILAERLQLNWDKYKNLSSDLFRSGVNKDSKETDEVDKARETKIVLPSAAELMKQNKLTPNDIKTSNASDRITYEDVVAHLERTRGITSDEENIIELTKVQKSIKNNMMRTLGIPVFRITHLIKTTALLKLFEKVKEKISMTVILSKCVSTVLLKHPIMFSTFIDKDDGKILINKDVNIGNALGLKDSLLTPVLKQVDKKDIYTLATEWKKLVEKGKGGLLTSNEMSGSNFYISNLGMFNTYQFDAILPQNASCILSVGTNIGSIENLEDFKIQKGMMMTLACDHRHIYGSHAAGFMNDLSAFIERDIMQIFL